MQIDSHCHLNSLSKNDAASCMQQVPRDSIFIDSSVDYENSLKSLELSRQHSFVYSSLGFHPFSAESFSLKKLKDYENLIDENKKIIAIGEIGLDQTAQVPFKEQEEVLGYFINLAKSKDLPIIIHNRMEDERILDILDKFFSGYERCIMHCFSYSQDFLKKIIDKGGFISFSLNILRNNEKILSSLKACPLDKLLLETDSPYMRIKGASSTPLDISKVYSRAASLKGIEEQMLEEAVSFNINKVFSLCP